MNQSSSTESVVRNHLQTFIQQLGFEAILRDYDDHATLLSEEKTYSGKDEIRGFFEDFLAALPPHAIERFSLRSLHVADDVASITWSAGPALPMGTDTFVVRNGKIVAQTFAMYAAPAP